MPQNGFYDVFFVGLLRIFLGKGQEFFIFPKNFDSVFIGMKREVDHTFICIWIMIGVLLLLLKINIT